jgi:hypothetical protein
MFHLQRVGRFIFITGDEVMDEIRLTLAELKIAAISLLGSRPDLNFFQGLFIRPL